MTLSSISMFSWPFGILHRKNPNLASVWPSSHCWKLLEKVIVEDACHSRVSHRCWPFNVGCLVIFCMFRSNSLFYFHSKDVQVFKLTVLFCLPNLLLTDYLIPTVKREKIGMCLLVVNWLCVFLSWLLSSSTLKLCFYYLSLSLSLSPIQIIK